MNIWIILVLIVLLPVIYLLAAPVYLEINTERDIYRFRFHRLVSTSFVMEQYIFFMDLKILWWSKRVELRGKGKKKKEAEKAERPEKGNKMPFSKLKRKITGVLTSFHIRKFYVTIDTGDVTLNGKLFPWVYLLGVKTGKNISVNFIGENKAEIQIENTLGGIAWAYIKS